MTCRRFPLCPPEGCWSDRCAVDGPTFEAVMDEYETFEAVARFAPRCTACNAVLPHDGDCIDLDCPACT